MQKMDDILCKKCDYVRFPGFDFCCKTCYESDGEVHGEFCKKRLASVLKQSKNTNCKNLKTNARLYDSDSTICFYNKSKPYYEFSNFYPSVIVIDDYSYATSENYYQSQKFYPDNMHIFKQIQLSKSPGDAFNTAHRYNLLVRKDWHAGYKNKVMLKVLREKFKQHEILRQLLLSTENKLLVEHTEKDNYWGDAGDGSGKNMLGKLLMKVRSEISEKSITNS